jgi:hypothetical protein
MDPTTQAAPSGPDAQATDIFAVNPLDATVTLRRFNDDDRISRYSRLLSMSRFSSALPGQKSEKLRRQVEVEVEDVATSDRNSTDISPSSFGELCTRMGGRGHLRAKTV